MNKQGKIEFVSEFKQIASEYPFMILTKQSGITVSAMSKFRRNMRGVDGMVCVVKNRLARIALKNDFPEEIIEMFSGPIAVLFAKDAVSGAKTAFEFAAKNEKKFEIVGGILDGKVISQQDVKELSSLPSLPQLHGKLLGVLVGNARQLLGVLQAPARQLVYLLDTYSKQ